MTIFIKNLTAEDITISDLSLVDHTVPGSGSTDAGTYNDLLEIVNSLELQAGIAADELVLVINGREYTKTESQNFQTSGGEVQSSIGSDKSIVVFQGFSNSFVINDDDDTVPFNHSNTQHLSEYVSHSTSVNPDKITIEEAGIYEIRYDCTFTMGTNDTGIVFFWVERNAGWLPESEQGQAALKGGGSQKVGSVSLSGLLKSLDADDVIKLGTAIYYGGPNDEACAANNHPVFTIIKH